MTNEEVKQSIQDEKDSDLRKDASEVIHQIEVIKDMGCTFDQALQMLIYFSLMGISSELENLETLTDCVDYVRGSAGFCIKGSIVNYEP